MIAINIANSATEVRDNAYDASNRDTLYFPSSTEMA